MVSRSRLPIMAEYTHTHTHAHTHTQYTFIQESDPAGGRPPREVKYIKTNIFACVPPSDEYLTI